MKKLCLTVLALASVGALAAPPEFQNVTKKQLEDVSNEFAMNFSHTTVSAPETDGVWGVEVGLVGGRTGSPKLKDLIDAAGEDGSDFENIYHAGLMARAHFPFDLFAEVSVLPGRDISDVEVESRSLGLGWNAGAFFGLPLDLAVGVNVSYSEIGFTQTIGSDANSDVSIESKTRVLWVGASKNFWIFTPYVKLGSAKSESDVTLDTTGGTIFTFSTSQKESVSSTGGFFALGSTVDLLFLRLGVEASRTADVKRVSGKLSFAF